MGAEDISDNPVLNGIALEIGPDEGVTDGEYSLENLKKAVFTLSVPYREYPVTRTKGSLSLRNRIALPEKLRSEIGLDYSPLPFSDTPKFDQVGEKMLTTEMAEMLAKGYIAAHLPEYRKGRRAVEVRIEDTNTRMFQKIQVPLDGKEPLNAFSASGMVYHAPALQSDAIL